MASANSLLRTAALPGVGGAISRRMLDRGWDHLDLARAARCKPGEARDAAVGLRALDPDTLGRVASALGSSAERLEADAASWSRLGDGARRARLAELSEAWRGARSEAGEENRVARVGDPLAGGALAPRWSPRDVAALNDRQRDSSKHPHTCPGRDDLDGCSGHRELIATPYGWICACGSYRQDWAHEPRGPRQAKGKPS